MKIKLFEHFINEAESISYEEMLEAVRSILGKEFKEKSSQLMSPEHFGLTTYFIYTYSNTEEKYFAFTKNKNDSTVELQMEFKTVSAGRSLADPRKAYQTTSATTTKTSRKKVHKTVKSAEKALEEVKKFKEKYNL